MEKRLLLSVKLYEENNKLNAERVCAFFLRQQKRDVLQKKTICIATICCELKDGQIMIWLCYMVCLFTNLVEDTCRRV